MNNIILSQIPFEDIKAAMYEVVNEVIESKLQALTPTKKEEFLTRSETAKKLGIALSTLHEYTLAGIVPAYRIGSRVRYKSAEVEQALTQIKSTKTV